MTDAFLHAHAVQLDGDRDEEGDEAKLALVDYLLSELTDKQREVVEMVVMSAIPITTAAELLGIPRPAASKRLQRARATMARAAARLAET